MHQRGYWLGIHDEKGALAQRLLAPATTAAIS